MTIADEGIVKLTSRIGAALQAQLDALWDWRNNDHLFMLAEWEYGKYELPHYNAAILTLRALRESIEKWAITKDDP